MLGVCLGMQGLVTAYGGASTASSRRTARSPGSTTTAPASSPGCRRTSAAVRYHSLAAAPVPDDLAVTATVRAGRPVVMAVRHRSLPLEGVQFHPESILSEHGAALSRTSWGGPVTRPRPAAYFREVAAAHPRCFWLDGGGAREWSGRRSIIGWLDDDDVS